ncbi:hypothetical protein QGX20_gp066 [Pseudomonas phage phiPsa300]|uniref:Uncharacterized protein n=1 Tax=Pseudomonas phage phiPsa300 TaxID=1460362 RepID=A0A7G9V189_9CAUD|nr:hypothetical protein QGX20_gp066 [Pseudomonas phage phiPsa300]QNO00045.1 hypothetical protein phiPsa300_156 [Pseudomonas phage phiPsa300]
MINIADKIWAVKAVGRDNLAYMCPYNLKRDGTPDAATAKMMNTGNTWAGVGPRPLYLKADGTTTTHYYDPNVVKEKKNGYDYPVQAGEVPAEQGASEVYDNVPMKGFKVGQDATRWTTENKVFRLHDPRGFTVEIPTGNLSTLIQTCTIINGEIMDECVWGREGCHVLLPINAPEYKAVVKKIEEVETALKLKDLKPGDFVKLHPDDHSERQFVGMVKLEWTQHRMLFDSVVDPTDNNRYSYYRTYKDTNFRDDGKEVIRDSQWVGLFATTVQEDCYLKEAAGNGSHYDKWEYSKPVLAVCTENNTAKITSRRSGELHEDFKDLNNVLARTNYYTSYSMGRRDCPDRVAKKFEKREVCDWRSKEDTKGKKNLTKEHFTATVYQEAKYD